MKAMTLLMELEGTLPKEVKSFVDFTYSRHNQGTWSKKSMFSLWFMTTANKGEMIISLRALRKEFADKGSKTRAKKHVVH